GTGSQQRREAEQDKGSWHLEVQPVQADGIVAADLALHRRVDTLEIAIYRLLRMRPRRDAVREVIRPQEVVFPVHLRRQHAGSIVLESEEDVAPEVVGGQHLV